MRKAYFRCNGGHYYRDEHCPLDGWSSAESREFSQILGRLSGKGEDPSLDDLRKAGMSASALGRTVVIEFGSPDSVFDALSPEGYILKGKWTKTRDLPLELL